jgi:hypothetical protein
MAVSQNMIDALEAAILSGEKSCTYDGRTVVYRDLDEMRSILTEAKAALAGNAPAAYEVLARRRTRVASYMDRGTAQANDPRLEWRG